MSVTIGRIDCGDDSPHTVDDGSWAENHQRRLCFKVVFPDLGELRDSPLSPLRKGGPIDGCRGAQRFQFARPDRDLFVSVDEAPNGNERIEATLAKPLLVLSTTLNPRADEPANHRHKSANNDGEKVIHVASITAS